MRPLQQTLSGIIAAVFTSLIVLGSLSLALSEGGISLAPTATSLPTSTAVLPVMVDIPETPATPFVQIITATFPPPPTACPPPFGWQPYTIQPGDTLDALAQLYSVTEAQISTANCLLSNSLLPGTILYIPPQPQATAISVASPTVPICGHPTDWVIYTVQVEDNLYRLSQAFGTTIAQLQSANCMGGSTIIRAGMQLYVPNVPTRTPTHTQPAPTSKPTTQPTTKPTWTLAPTQTSLPTSTAIPTRTPTALPTSTSTLTSLPTMTSTPTQQPTSTPTVTTAPSETSMPSETPALIATP